MNALGIYISAPGRSDDARALGLFDCIGRANHACAPNARLTSDDGDETARAFSCRRGRCVPPAPPLRPTAAGPTHAQPSCLWLPTPHAPARQAQATLRASREIACGEELRIDYLAGLEISAAEKRALLCEQYLFECACPACRAANTSEQSVSAYH